MKHSGGGGRWWRSDLDTGVKTDGVKMDLIHIWKQIFDGHEEADGWKQREKFRSNKKL